MSGPKNRREKAFDDINELLGYYAYETKGETLAAQLGLLMGWMSRLASTDLTVNQELEARLDKARGENLSLKDKLKSPIHKR